jgi:hypothetical protein
MEIAYSSSTVQTPAYHGSDARNTDMEIVCWRSTIRTAFPLGPDARKPYMEITCSGHATVWTQLSNRKDFQRKSKKLWSHSCPFGQLKFTVRTTSVHITPVAHLNPQPINRGSWALRIARIQYWIPSELRELFCEVVGADSFSLKPLQVCCCCATTEVYLRGRVMCKF